MEWWLGEEIGQEGAKSEYMVDIWGYRHMLPQNLWRKNPKAIPLPNPARES